MIIGAVGDAVVVVPDLHSDLVEIGMRPTKAADRYEPLDGGRTIRWTGGRELSFHATAGRPEL